MTVFFCIQSISIDKTENKVLNKFINPVTIFSFKLLYRVGEYMLALYMTFIDDEKNKPKFEIIYYTYREKMLLMADSVLHNRQDAEDAVHDTFIKIARNMKSIGEPESNKTLSYVLKATKNTAINLHDKNKSNDNRIYFDNIDDISDHEFLDKLDISENYNKVVQAILKLDDKYKDVMFYHFVQEMKVSEVADLLGRKKSTVKQQLVRGKKLLLETLDIE